MPAEFLAEVLEWNEAVEEARAAGPGSPAATALVELDGSLRDHRTAVMEEVSGLLTPLPAAHAPELASVRRRLNAVRYLDRTLEEIWSGRGKARRLAPGHGVRANESAGHSGFRCGASNGRLQSRDVHDGGVTGKGHSYLNEGFQSYKPSKFENFM